MGFHGGKPYRHLPKPKHISGAWTFEPSHRCVHRGNMRITVENSDGLHRCEVGRRSLRVNSRFWNENDNRQESRQFTKFIWNSSSRDGNKIFIKKQRRGRIWLSKGLPSLSPCSHRTPSLLALGFFLSPSTRGHAPGSSQAVSSSPRNRPEAGLTLRTTSFFPLNGR